MATPMIHDTLKLAEQLEHEAGFDAARAKALARILAENTGGNFATREDILVLATKGELQAEIRGVRGEVQGVRGEIQDLRVEIQDIRGDVRVLYWITGTTLAGVAGLLGIAVTVALHVMRLG